MTNRLEQVADWCEGFVAFLLAFAAAVKQDHLYSRSPHLEEFAHAKGGQVDTVITVVVVAVVGVVGLLIYSEVEGALPLDVQGARNDPGNASTLENASASVGDGFGDAIDLVPIVLIVLVAALVIGVIQRFR